MAKFVPKEKLSKKARKELDAQKRTLWQYSPVTIRIESKKTMTAGKDPMTVMMITAWDLVVSTVSQP